MKPIPCTATKLALEISELRLDEFRIVAHRPAPHSQAIQAALPPWEWNIYHISQFKKLLKDGFIITMQRREPDGSVTLLAKLATTLAKPKAESPIAQWRKAYAQEMQE